jgi:hypothetical protein
MTIRIERAYFDRWGVDTNATPRAIDRRDRRTLGVWFVHIFAGPVALWISGTAAQETLTED